MGRRRRGSPKSRAQPEETPQARGRLTARGWTWGTGKAASEDGWLLLGTPGKARGLRTVTPSPPALSKGRSLVLGRVPR